MVKESMQRDQMGSIVKKILLQATLEKRLLLGITEIVKFLTHDQNNLPIMCFMASTTQKDYASHMQEVLLQAYCLENDIYIVKVDNIKNFNRILGSSTTESCALVCANPSGDSDSEGSFLDQDYQMTKNERKVIDFCEDHWEDSEHSTIRLPEKWDLKNNLLEIL